jgi:hypothetical protein
MIVVIHKTCNVHAPKVYLIRPPIGYPVIHQFRGKKVDNWVDDLWGTGPGGG